VNIEIERRFFVNPLGLKGLIFEKSLHITQYYLDDYSYVGDVFEIYGQRIKFDDTMFHQAKVWRLRKIDEQFWLSGKSEKIDSLALEFERRISEKKYNLIQKNLAVNPIEKTRHHWRNGEHLWEIDVFEDELSSLIIAEIELKNKGENFEIPQWIEREITNEKQWSNAQLFAKINL
tara:strand:- start:4353 stop:4880 length:528 start_codon:yes stop_codon:yes gene_type:complete